MSAVDPWSQQFCSKLVEMRAGLQDNTEVQFILNETGSGNRANLMEKGLRGYH